jgi:hypothetical protein
MECGGGQCAVSLAPRAQRCSLASSVVAGSTAVLAPMPYCAFGRGFDAVTQSAGAGESCWGSVEPRRECEWGFRSG